MKPGNAEPELQLPERLRRQFESLRHRLWWVDTTLAVCGGLSALLVSYSVLFISDRFWDTPVWLRLLLIAAGVGLAAWFAVGWTRQWWWQPRDSKALARIVQRHYRRLGDRLLGIVELSDERSQTANVSPALRRKAIEQVSEEAVRFDFKEAVATRRARIITAVCLVILAGVLLPAVFAPAASWNTFTRWIWPAADVPRYTFVSIDDLPPRMIVPHGEPFEIAFQVRARSFWRPQHATARFDFQPGLSSPVRAGRVLFEIPAQTRPGTLRLKVGDIAREILIEPTLRPALKELMATIHFPEYLRHPAATQEVNGGVLRFLENSRLAFEGRVTRDLDEATVHAGSSLPAPVEADRFRTPVLDVSGREQITFHWRDSLGLSNATPWPLALTALPDAPPASQLPNQPAAIAVLENEVLDISFAAQDDYGLRELGVRWEAQKRQETNLLARHESVLTEGSPESNRLEGAYRFSPSLQKIPTGTHITLRAFASDYFPGREPSLSRPHRIYVLDPEEHARLIQQQFEQLLAALEDLTRDQESLLQRARDARELPPEDLESDETGRELGRQALEQFRNAEKLDQLADRGEETLREALRNPSIPSELLQDWADHLEAMENIADQEMQQASQALKSSQQSPPQRGEQLDRAAELQEEIVSRLRAMQREMSPNLELMLANTLAQRMRRVASTESHIQETLEDLLARVIGLRPEQLSADLLKTLDTLASRQDVAGNETRGLQEEISRFYDRTSITNYGKVSHEMRDTQIVSELTRSVATIGKNLAAQTIDETELWAAQLNEWADDLEAGMRASDESQAGEQADPNEQALQRLLELLRIRQDEINLRDLTTLLHPERDRLADYKDESGRLAFRQRGLMYRLDDLVPSTPLVAEARRAMDEAESYLREPRTDEVTVAAETDAINLLEAEVQAMMQSAEQSAQGPGMSAAMAMLMQMMGVGPAGQQPGANFSGGTTDQPSSTPAGDGSGAPGDSQSVEKATGGEAQAVPVEFRDALQNYYKAIEELRR